MKTKNPKKVEAGRKGAEARKRKREELEKQARAGQARAHAEVSHGDMAAPSDEPPRHEPSSPRQPGKSWRFDSVDSIDPRLVIGGVVLVGAAYLAYKKYHTAAKVPTEPRQAEQRQTPAPAPKSTSAAQPQRSMLVHWE
jgi:hypothetical protein